MIINVCGLEITVYKKDISNIHLSVLPPDGNVVISAPHSLDEKTISLFAIDKLSWIKRQQKKIFSQLRQAPREYVDGETYYLFGNQYFLKTVISNRVKVFIDNKNLVLSVKDSSSFNDKKNALSEFYRKQLKAELPRIIEKYENATGLKAKSYRIMDMKTKWGSCNYEKKTILLNLQLAKKPISCIEYIVLHEIGHLLYKTHNKDFIKFLDSFMPFWREEKKKINDLYLPSFEDLPPNA